MFQNKTDLFKNKFIIFQIKSKKQSKAVYLIGCSENIREILKKRSTAQRNLNKADLQQNNISGPSTMINL